MQPNSGASRDNIAETVKSRLSFKLFGRRRCFLRFFLLQISRVLIRIIAEFSIYELTLSETITFKCLVKMRALNDLILNQESTMFDILVESLSGDLENLVEGGLTADLEFLERQAICTYNFAKVIKINLAIDDGFEVWLLSLLIN